jgi:hypothetical protein
MIPINGNSQIFVIESFKGLYIPLAEINVCIPINPKVMRSANIKKRLIVAFKAAWSWHGMGEAWHV